MGLIIRLAVFFGGVLLALTACADDPAEKTPTETSKLETQAVTKNTAKEAGTSKNPAVNLLEKFQEGVHYFAINPSVPVDDNSKIEVAEMFWYGCSHCFAFEPILNQWKTSLANDVNFIRVPALWNPIMEAHARLFYTAKKLGVLEDSHQAIFNEIHINGKRLDKTEDIANLLEKFGADKKDVINDLNSFEITSQVKKADVRARSYKIGGVPNVVVDGRYRVETNENVQQDNMLEVVDFLIKKTRAAKK
ncbi:MAG: thiol:disulfide interchange protein DsbA/DsbL [Cellvibrionaceae bacterium]